MSRNWWTPEEIQLVRDNKDVEVRVIADKLGRTPRSVYNMRNRIRFGELDVPDYDTRPSGWYTGMVGLLLIQNEDAWNSWKHYHRAVEVHVESSDTSGWVTLRYRRDADAA